MKVLTKKQAYWELFKLFFVPDEYSFKALRIHLKSLKAMFKELYLILHAKILGHYKTPDRLPVFNFFKALEGEYQYLYKFIIKKYPRFFKRLFMGIFYQLETVNNEDFRDMHNLAYLRSLVATASTITEKNKYLNKANFLEAQMKTKKKAKSNNKKSTLDQMVTEIEETMGGIGQINVHKISVSRFFSLYNRTIEKKKKDANN